MPKTVFVAHPISGDIEGNLQRVLAICGAIHSPEVIPVAPYLISLRYLDDTVAEDRALGIAANRECFHRRFVDELWLFGDRISPGMEEEVNLALDCGIPIYPKTEGTERDLALLLRPSR